MWLLWTWGLVSAAILYPGHGGDIMSCKYMPQMRMFLMLNTDVETWLSSDTNNRTNSSVNGRGSETAVTTANGLSPAPHQSNQSATLAWIGLVPDENASLIHMMFNDSDTFDTSFRNSTIGEFLKEHYRAMRAIAIGTNDTASPVLVHSSYDCCYFTARRSICGVRRGVTQAVDATDADNSSLSYESLNGNHFQDFDNSTTTWQTINSSILSDFWSHVKTASSKWQTFLELAARRNQPHTARGMTRVLRDDGHNSTVECAIRAQGNRSVDISWFVGDTFVRSYNVTNSVQNNDGTTSEWSIVSVGKHDVDNLYCYVSSRGRWGVAIPVPYTYAPLPIGGEVSLPLLAGIVAALVLFAILGSVTCGVLMCRRHGGKDLTLP
uniref:Membrane protein a160 n=1 Tax=Mastomys natalensis cytomegalovirus 1 TaxID=2973541 RepID=A0A9Y1IQ80_9BETA|nr:membrane protein a160 [Mastomys natalensis cytomegalovirus 1]WEG71237.1 membrane protein a160 [Mastomys natalensis cytomegalovirus 1]